MIGFETFCNSKTKGFTDRAIALLRRDTYTLMADNQRQESFFPELTCDELHLKNDGHERWLVIFEEFLSAHQNTELKFSPAKKFSDLISIYLYIISLIYFPERQFGNDRI